MKKNKNIYLYLVLVLCFSLIAIFVREQSVYQEALSEKVYESIPSNNERTGFMFRKLEKNLTLEEDNGIQTLSLKPGAVFEGNFLVKNNYLTEKEMSLVWFGQFQQKNEHFFRLEFPESNFFSLKPGEWKIVKYKILVPEDMPVGDYNGSVALRSSESIKYSGTTNVVLAIAIEYNINVSGEPKEYEFQNILDKDLKPSNLALKYVYNDLKVLMGYVFGILSLFFLYKAVFSDKKKIIIK